MNHVHVVTKISGFSCQVAQPGESTKQHMRPESRNLSSVRRKGLSALRAGPEGRSYIYCWCKCTNEWTPSFKARPSVHIKCAAWWRLSWESCSFLSSKLNIYFRSTFKTTSADQSAAQVMTNIHYGLLGKIFEWPPDQLDAYQWVLHGTAECCANIWVQDASHPAQFWSPGSGEQSHASRFLLHALQWVLHTEEASFHPVNRVQNSSIMSQRLPFLVYRSITPSRSLQELIGSVLYSDILEITFYVIMKCTLLFSLG